MKLKNSSKSLMTQLMAAAMLLAGLSVPARAINIVYSGTSQAADQAVLSLIQGNFSDVNINYGNFSDYTANAAVIEAADLFIIGRRLSSADYANPTNSASFNSLTVPVVAFTSYVTRPLDGRWGWHDGDVAAGLSTVGDETTITAGGASVFGVADGVYNWFPDTPTFNAAGTGSVGDGEILATIGGNILAAHWNAGDLSGTGATFGSDRFLFNLTEMTGGGTVTTLPNAAGQQALISALEAFTPLTALSDLWNVNGGGSFNVAGNWSENAVPTQNPVFGSILTEANAPATVTLDSPATLNRVSFQNPNQYILAGPSTLTLTGAREVAVGTGSHQITANIAGTAGLVKTGAGTLILPNAKSYTGTTDVQGGTLLLNNLDAVVNQASGVVNIAAETASVVAGPGATGTLAAELTGIGQFTLGADLAPTDTVTISRSNAAFDGVVRVESGTLSVSNNNALGIGGFGFNRTHVTGLESAGKIVLPGNITVNNEVLTLEARENAGFNNIHLTSTGNNTWNGNIIGETGGTQYNIESTSGTLTLGGTITTPDSNDREVVFSGNGNFSVKRISDGARDADGNLTVAGTDATVSVIKRGSGTLTITTASTDLNEYWLGRTDVEQGTLTITAGAGDAGEIASPDILVRDGATFNVSSFGTYSQQIGQLLRGDGTISAGTLALFDDGSVAPGDSPGAVGSLSVTGNVSLEAFATPGTEGAWSFDLGNTANPASDVLAVSGSFTASGSPALTVDVTPTHGHLDAGSRTIVTHSGGAVAAVNGIVARATDLNGTPLNTRQTFSVNGNTAGQINVVVTGEEASRTWNGNASGAWDVATSNWQEGDQQYRDLDHVTFDGSAIGTKSVVVDGVRSPGSVTFNGAAAYSFSGLGGIVGSGEVSVMGAGEVTLGNKGNSYSGSTTVASGSSLRYTADAATGSITNSGKLTVGNPIDLSDSLGIVNGDFELDAADNVAPPTGWTDLSVADAGGSPPSFWTGVPDEPGNPSQAIVDLAPAPGLGNYFLTTARESAEADQPTNGTLVQTVDLSLFAANIDDGDQQLFVDFVWGSADNRDTGTVSLHFFSNNDGTGSELGTSPSVAMDDENGFEFVGWLEETVGGEVPIGARSVTIQIDSMRSGGTATNIWMDNFNGKIGESFGGPASLEMAGDLMLMDGSVLELVVEKTDSFSKVLVDGLLTADGTFQFTALNDTVFNAGDVFDVFDFDSVTGAFDNITLPTLTGGLDWDASNLLVTGELSVISVALPGDFNLDGDVDGRDFLLWQRNPAIGDLADWKANYGGGSSVANSAAVPEPTTAGMLMAWALVTCSLAGRKHRNG